MEKILKSTYLDYEKSSFLLEMVEQNEKLKYISIKQIFKEENKTQTIKINPKAIDDILYVIGKYSKSINPDNKNQSFFAEENQKKLIKRYLNGITIRDLSIQFNIDEESIRNILSDNDIEIVEYLELVKDKLDIANQKVRKLSSQQEKAIAKLYLNGSTLDFIAEKYKISSDQVLSILEDFNLDK